MTTKTFYPNSVTQTSGSSIASFTTLNNIKVYNSDYAYATVTGKTGSKPTPAKITATNFNISVPTGAVINKITVEYRQQKTKSGTYYPSLPAPKVSLANTGLKERAGSMPSSSASTASVTWNVGTVNKANITSNNFGVRIEYQKNTGDSAGELRVYWVRVIVDYTPTQYTITNTKTQGEYNGDEYRIRTTVSNVNKTPYTPTVTITAPLGLTFKELVFNGGGEFNVIDNRTFTWKPPFKANTSNLQLELSFDSNVTYSTGQTSVTLVYTVVESLNQATKNTNIVVKKTRVTPVTPTDPVSPTNPNQTEMDVPALVFPEAMVPTDVTFKVPPRVTTARYFKFNNLYDTIKVVNDDGTLTGLDDIEIDNDLISEDNTVTLKLQLMYQLTFPSSVDLYEYMASESQGVVKTFNIYNAYKFGLPNATILEITDTEELDRLGHHIPYTVQSDYLCTTENDYYTPISKNYKLGVFNNPILDNITITETTDPVTGEVTETITDTTDYDNLTTTEILTNAEYWSEYFLQNINVNRSMECKFVYDENYPLYIIMTGDYPEFDNTDDTLTFNTPCIIETEDYTQRTTPNPFYIPIADILTEDISTITLDAYETGSSIKLYNLDLDDDFGTNNNISIRGIEVIGDIECNNDATITVKLKNNNGAVGTRSTIINPDTTTLSIGGLGDLYGYIPTQLTQLKDWVIEIETNNVYDIAVDIQITNLQVKIYYVEIETQENTCYINGENINYYGAFLTDLKIPSGLKTSTSFLTLDGTDTNDAYRQNIREKEIELHLDVGDCNLTDSTNQLKELTQLIVNDKDKYNRPIPKKVEFTHYPDLYWEYIIEDTFDTDIDISTYELKVKLTVPSGTAYRKTPTVVYNSGYIHGLASINPLITIKPTGTHITLTETESEQKWNISYSEYAEDDIYIIDCENRTVNIRKQNTETTENDIDISSYVDFNSDWFTLDNNFVIDAENCIIQNITYTERW